MGPYGMGGMGMGMGRTLIISLSEYMLIFAQWAGVCRLF